jgi:S1-C subfamily serine protease
MLLAAALFLLAISQASAHSTEPADAVFQIRVVQFLPGGAHWTVAQGTGFFTDSDGTALTNSHVVYRAVRDPAHYQLVAIVGANGSAEFYGVTVDCATALPYDPADLFRTSRVTPGRDLARIHVIASRLPLTTWVEFLPSGRTWPIATRHAGSLPSFPSLRIGGPAAPGMHVRVTGYRAQLAPVDKETLNGQVEHLERTPDGTNIFSVALNPSAGTARGYSGSPVLDDRDQVVGLWTWSASPDSTALGSAQSGGALIEPCR